MFRPAKIYHTNIAMPEDMVDKLIAELHELGICELKEADIDLDSKYSYEYAKNVLEIKARLKFIMDSLEDYKEVPQPENLVKALFKPTPPKKHKVTSITNDKLVEEIKYHLDLIEPKVTEKINNLNQLQEQIQNNNFIISNLSLIPDIKTNLLQSTDNIKVFLGIITTSSLDKIQKELEKENLLLIDKKEKNLSLIAVFVREENYSVIDKILHEAGFEIIEIPYKDQKPLEIIRNLKEENFKSEEKERKIKSSLKKIQKAYEKKLDIMNEELGIAIEKIEALQKFKTTNAFSVLEAWIPAKNIEKFNALMKKSCKNYYFEIIEKDDAPTIFDNPPIIKPFELITELYSPPKYKSLDPTPILAFSFAIFFGFMLTDFAYGILLVLFGYGMYKGIGSINPAMRRFSKILVIFGISTMVLGAIFSSYFGNFFQSLGIKMPGLIDPMKDVMLALSLAIGLGALHLMIGLIAGFYENVHNKNIKNAFASQGVWIFFMVGILLILVKSKTFGLVLIGIAVLMQLFFNYLSSGFVTSLLSIFGFSSFIGDLFSYARLMALGIGTSGISLAVNFMAFLSASMIPVVGIVVAIIIFIIGHSFNILMNGLGGFIHSTRLHFLEFFTKFYEGGGRSYKPFKAMRKTTYMG